jgi:hypothetical protein
LTTTGPPPPPHPHSHHPPPNPRPAQAILQRNSTTLLSSVLSFICPRSPLFAVAHRRGCVVDRQSSLASHRPPLTLMLPLLVDCCLFIPLVDGGGLGPSSAPPIQQTHPPPPLSSLEKFVAKAAESWWPRHLSLCLCSRAANIGHHPCVGVAQVSQHRGGAGGRGWCSLEQFPSRPPRL